MQIGDKPSVVLKFGRVERRIFAKTADQIWSGKHGRREDNFFTMDTAHFTSVQVNDIDAFPGRHDRDDDLRLADLLTDFCQ